MGCQLDKLMPFWQLARILHSVIILILSWQINIVVVAAAVGVVDGELRPVYSDTTQLNSTSS